MALKRIIPQWILARRRAMVLGILLAVVLAYGIFEINRKPWFLPTLAMAVRTPPSQWQRSHAMPKFKGVYERDGCQYLPGGETEKDDFDVTEFRLEPGQIFHGIGREHFSHLIEPTFVSAEQADEWLPDQGRVLAVGVGEEVKVYPVDLLLSHEVVNDVVGGRPVFAAYCILADLGTVYECQYEDQVFTFATSSYTYADPEVWEGRNAFLLWDRETESLWWPPLGKAVSGSMIDAPMKVLDQDLWAQTTWGELKAKHPEALVLQAGQGFNPPTKWPQLESPPEVAQSEAPETEAIAPHWGENVVL